MPQVDGVHGHPLLKDFLTDGMNSINSSDFDITLGRLPILITFNKVKIRPLATKALFFLDT